MNLISASSAPIVRVIDGRTVEFRPLTRDEIGGLLARWAAEEQAALAERLKLAGIGGRDALVELQALAEQSGLLSWMLLQVEQYRRAREVVAASSGATEAAVPVTELPALACELIWPMRAKPMPPDDAGEDGESPLTGSPGTAGETGTWTTPGSPTSSQGLTPDA